MVQCPRCKGQWPQGSQCPNDGTPLVPAPAPTTRLRTPVGPGDDPTENVTVMNFDSAIAPTVMRGASPAAKFDPDSLIGRRLGEYDVTGRLGSGGMGLVYEGVQALIGKQVAIKVLRPELAGDATLNRRFLDEARAVNAVRHPGLIDIFSFGELPEGPAYFVMERLQGETLEALLTRLGALALHQCIDILQQACDALAAAHGAGVLHRDLKPSNIFLVRLPDGRQVVKLLDFGLAKRVANREVTHGGFAIGTPHYMSPEQATAQPLSTASDLYGLGCVAYELLSGNVPFDGGSGFDIMLAQVNQPPPPLRERVAGLRPDIEALVMRMLEKEPTQRPSAREVRRELLRIGREVDQAETRAGPTVAAAEVPVTVVLDRSPVAARAVRPATPVPPRAATPLALVLGLVMLLLGLVAIAASVAYVRYARPAASTTGDGSRR